MGEFDLIKLISAAAPDTHEGVEIGIGDDAAVLEVPAGQDLVATCDTLNEDVHFLASCAPESVGHKALAVSLSDLAAMGARPAWVLLSLSMPQPNRDWLAGFMAGFSRLAANHGVSLAGGDLCSGPLSVTVTALGLVSRKQRILRSGMLPGDLIVVSGYLGDAAMALRAMKQGERPASAAGMKLEQPQPRVALGAALVGHARACIDVSDGLANDLGHLAEASACGILIELESLPASEQVSALKDGERWATQLCGGDDYELCFALPERLQNLIVEWEQDLGLQLTVIGRSREGTGVEYIDGNGTSVDGEWYGYDHFKADS